MKRYALIPLLALGLAGCGSVTQSPDGTLSVSNKTDSDSYDAVQDCQKMRLGKPERIRVDSQDEGGWWYYTVWCHE